MSTKRPSKNQLTPEQIEELREARRAKKQKAEEEAKAKPKLPVDAALDPVRSKILDRHWLNLSEPAAGSQKIKILSWNVGALLIVLLNVTHSSCI